MSFVHPLVVGFLVALGVGLLIGIDRERNKGDGATRQPAGLRTFTLGLPGWARRRWRVGDEIAARGRQRWAWWPLPASPTGGRATAIPG